MAYSHILSAPKLFIVKGGGVGPVKIAIICKALFLTYHHLDEKESFVTISPMKFNQHLLVLKENHNNVIPIEAYVCFQEHQKSIPPNAVVITFDDGYRSFYEKVYP